MNRRQFSIQLAHATAAAAIQTQASAAVASNFGSYWRPFAADSLWNSRPLAPVLGDYVLPMTRYHPFVGPGPYSSGIFLAQASDPPMIIYGRSNPAGVWCPDDGEFRQLTVPCWPKNVVAAKGSDGHADIVDQATGIIHSFWQLRFSGGRWQAEQYAWSALAGRGFGDPAHNHQGARAAGVATMGGMIRKHEIDEAQPYYRHALALSLDGSALQSGYVFPATAQDNNAAARYRGRIAMGSLLMLPDNFDASALATPHLRKVAQTLKRFGGRVVDQNEDTRFVLYVENGADFDLHRWRWNSPAAADLDRIGDALRPLHHAGAWSDGNERPFTPESRLNLISLRGPWRSADGQSPPVFDSWSQSLRFTAATEPQQATQSGERAQRFTDWAPWQQGRNYRLSVAATGDARLRLQLRDPHAQLVWDSGELGDGASARFVMPASQLQPTLIAVSGPGASSLRGQLHEQ